MNFRSEMRLGIVLSLALVISSLSGLSTVSKAQNSFELPPSDIVSLRANLAKSFVGIECAGKTGIAFAGNYFLTEEDMNQGRRSLLVTNKDLVMPCLTYDGSRDVKVLKDDKSYVGRVWGWSALNAEDYATVSSSLEPPKIGLYDEAVPEAGWWVMVASFLPGFGITWTNSKIVSVNLKEYFLLLESSPASLGTGGPVFDNRGSFLGIVTFVQNTNVGLAKVSGSPNVCNAPGSLSGSGIANCQIGTKDKVWTKKVASPTPTPTATDAARDAYFEALDAYNAALDAYNLGRVAKSECVKAYQSSNTATRRILSLVSGSRICSSQDEFVNAAYKGLLLLDPEKTTVKDPLASIERLNKLTDQFNIFAEAMDEGVVFAEELRDSANELVDIENLIEVLESYSSSIETVLERLPSKIKNYLYLKPEIESFIDLNNEFVDTSEKFKGALSAFSGLSYVDFEALEEFQSSIDLASRLLPTEESMDGAQSNALKVIPGFYCKKGKVVSLPSKGKCSYGSNKIKIDKTW